ncbi:MAG: putative toxin-antitoxin system toxin component, PIN family [Bacteroidetes bacterium]|nr:putative toxin-antitoxin system toxin component, PIN family [Bacteroidota bacterium]
MNIIIDTNIWISFTIGKRLKHLKSLLINPEIQIFICDEIINEYTEVVYRPKIKKYISSQRIKETIEIIKLSTINKKRVSRVKLSRDKNDDFLLGFSIDVNADFLITGDKDLLILGKFKNTKIITFDVFLIILSNLHK